MDHLEKEITALILITGRGLGGDAVIGLNIIEGLRERNIRCEIALDESAEGLLFKKNNMSWHKVTIPQAGGHAATKSSMFKVGGKTLRAVLKTRKLIKKVNADVIVGVIGGGAVISCLASKMMKIPSVCILSTPLDTKICKNIATSIILPENPLFKKEIIPSNMHRSFFPIKTEIMEGNKLNALKNIEIHCQKVKENNPKAIDFDKSKNTILFSSGSTLFEKTVRATCEFSNISNDYNLIIVGSPLEEKYLDWIDETKIINLGYIDWISDLYSLADCAVLTDDGLMLQEAIICNLPVIILTKVKYGRYHNMAAVFKGATIEADREGLEDSIKYLFSNYNEFKLKTEFYTNEIISSKEHICDTIINALK